MQRLLERLERRIEWTLLAPRNEGEIGIKGGADEHALLQRMLALRVAVGLTPDQPEPRHAFSAAGSWHLIATDQAGAIAGAVRVYVIDRQREPLAPADLAQISHVVFPCDRVQQQHLLALRRLFDEKVHERYFTAPGGLFTTPAWRGSGLAAALGAAAIAMARLHDSRFSASYTAARGRAQDLFTTFGGKPPMLPDGRPLAPFTCQRHGFDLQLLVFDAQTPGPRAEPGVHLMAERLKKLMARQDLTA